MKANNIFKIGLFATALALTACSEDFLEVEPQTKSSLDEYFSTKEHITEALIAAYNPIHTYDYYVDQDGNGQYTPLIFSDLMADNMLVGAANAQDQEEWHLAANYASTAQTPIWGIWDVSYQGVKRCNDVLGYVAKATAVSQADKNALEAEARVLRAFYYTQLWKFYGYVPYFEENLSSPYRAEQISADEVYAHIVADLDAAIALNALPLAWDTNNLGRVSQAVAYMLYAEVVMYQNDTAKYPTALGYMKDIIADDADYDLAPDYTKIFTPEGEWSKESIFEINYTDGTNSGRSYDYVWGVGGTILPRVISPDGGVPALGIQNGWGTFIVRQSAYDMYSQNDDRRDATCLVAPAGGYKPRYQDTGIFLNKYMARSENVAADTGGAPDMRFNNNLRVYRFAETLLNAAELSLRTGGAEDGEAKTWLNRVRERAGLNGFDKATLDVILQERNLEFVGEGKRYWDLVRTGEAATVLVADGVYRTNSWTPAAKYLPIAQKELSADENLKQVADFNK